jgi:hypothetical protein
METSLTPDALRRARRTIGVTQATLATDTGVNATIIKHFETYRLSALPASAQESLVAYFKQKGVSLADGEGQRGTGIVTVPVQPGTTPPRMSFAVSGSLSDQTIESALDRMDGNDEEIADLMRKVTSKGILGAYTDQTVMDSQRLFGLMAENYMLFRYLQGENFLEGIDQDAEDETHAHIVRRKATDSGSPLVAAPDDGSAGDNEAASDTKLQQAEV